MIAKNHLIRHEPLACCLVLALWCGISHAETQRASDHLWPTYRHDNSLAGMSPLSGGLGTRPMLQWSIDLGAAKVPAEQWRFADFDGDGTNDFLRVLDDRLICESIAGTPLWEANELPRPQILQMLDFAGNGRIGLLVQTDDGVQTRFQMIDGATGESALLYAMQNVFGNSMRVGHVLPNVQGQQLCAWWSGEMKNAQAGNAAAGHGYLWSFEDGLAKPKLRFEAHPTGTIYAPLHLFADMNGDNATDMVMISHENIWCWDLQSGQLHYHHRWGPEIRTYWAQTAAIPLNAGELPSLLMINPMLPGVQVVTQDGKSAAVKWKQVVGEKEDQYQTKIVIGPGAPDPFVDLDGNGDIEIMASVRNEHGDGRTHLVIFNANTGKRMFDRPDIQVFAVDDLDSDGVPEVLLKEGEFFKITNWNTVEFANRWQSRDAVPLHAPMPPEGDLQRAVGARNTGPNRTLQRVESGSSQFLLQFGKDAATKSTWACALSRTGGLQKVRELESQTVLGKLPGGKAAAAEGMVRVEGDHLVFSVQGREVRRRKISKRRAFLPTPPLVGTLGGKTRVVARDFAGTLVSYSASGTEPRALIAQAQGPSERSHLSMDGIGTICDVDGDGVNELVAATQEGGLAVVAVDARGQVRRRFAAGQEDSQWVLAGVGSLGEGRGCSVVVRHKTGNDSWASPWVVDAYDGQSGKRLWQRSWYGRYGGDARKVKFALHIPTAFYDYNRDGADDLFVNSENFYGIIDVSTGQDLIAPAEGTAALGSDANPQLCFSNRIPGHWTAYATPIVVNPAGGEHFVLMSRAFALTVVIDVAGNPRWHYGLTRDTTARSHAGIGDLDGDGKLEVVTSQADGLLRAFSAGSIEATCPSCPPTQKLNADTHSGHIRWEYKLKGPVSDIASADLDGDGRHELLVGTAGGSLYALDEVSGTCEVLWRCAFNSRVGSPVVADLDADGTAEILVPIGDGNLHCLKAAKAAETNND